MVAGGKIDGRLVWIRRSVNLAPSVRLDRAGGRNVEVCFQKSDKTVSEARPRTNLQTHNEKR